MPRTIYLKAPTMPVASASLPARACCRLSRSECLRDGRRVDAFTCAWMWRRADALAARRRSRSAVASISIPALPSLAQFACPCGPAAPGRGERFDLPVGDRDRASLSRACGCRVRGAWNLYVLHAPPISRGSRPASPPAPTAFRIFRPTGEHPDRLERRPPTGFAGDVPGRCRRIPEIRSEGRQWGRWRRSG